MKKKTIKNYIAFTLTEMTMVLLIMSVLAAVTAPIVKHAVSDVVNTSEADSSDANPWKKLSNLSGIFYSSVGNGIVSVGTIPSGAPTNYNYPAMIIQSNGGDKTNLVSQLGFYNASTSNSQRMSFDRYNNIAIGRNIKSNADNNVISTIPYGKIEIGSDIGTGRLKNSAQSVIIGRHVLNGSYASANHTISIGYMNSNQGGDGGINHDNSINIGYATAILGGTSTDNQNSTNIGFSVANKSYVNNGSINIGSSAGSSANSHDTVSIGSLAGFVEDGSGYNGVLYSYSNINLGRYAGFVAKVHPSAISNLYKSYASYGNINIGQFAGAFTTKPKKTSVENGSKYFIRQDNIAIGLGTLATSWKYDSLTPVNRVGSTCDDTASLDACNKNNKAFVSSPAYKSDIAIGAFAGNNLLANTKSYANHNLILIGAYAGTESLPFYYSDFFDTQDDRGYKNALKGTIAIGPFAGYKMGRCRYSSDDAGIGHEPESSIMIGYYAGYSNKIPGIIAIGNYAGSTTNYDESFNGISSKESTNIFIGEYAGYRSKGDAIGIGRYACASTRGSAIMCFGNFPYAMMGGKINGSVYTVGTNKWGGALWGEGGTSNTVYFYAGAGVGQQSDLILAAKTIYSVDGTITSLSSDARSKRKINLVNYGIKDFRKFDIYNFTLKADKSHEKHIGVIAQEYRKAFPLGLDKNGKYYSVKLDWLYYSMINAVKDLDKLIQEFQVKFDEYINNFESIKARIDVLEKAVAQEKTNNENMRKQLEQINSKLNAKK